MNSLEEGNTTDIKSSQHHGRFYFQDDPMAIFLVESQLFRIHRRLLIQESEVFRDMFSVPSNEGKETEGMRDEHPIRLQGVMVKEFELLLEYLYHVNQPVSDEMPESELEQRQEENLVLLRIAHRFAFDKVFRHTVERLDAAKLPILQRIRLGDSYHLEKWLFSAYEELLHRSEPPTSEELDALGWDRVNRFIQARDAIHNDHLGIKDTEIFYRDKRIQTLEKKLDIRRSWPLPINLDSTRKSAAEIATKYFTVAGPL